MTRGDTLMDATVEFENFLYETPDNWGEVFYFTQEQAEEAAEGLCEAFDEEVSIEECTKLTFIKQVDSETAMYKGHSNNYRDTRGYLFRREGKDYSLLEIFGSLDDYCYECKTEKDYCDCE